MRILTFGLAFVWASRLAGVGAAVAAPADGKNSVAITNLTFEGNVPAEAQKVFVERLAEGFAKADVQLKGGARMVRPEGCADRQCYRQVAAQHGAAYLVAGKVIESQKNYEIELELFTGATGRTSGNHRQRCQICGLSEAGERMSFAASALTERLKALLREPGHVVIKTQPALAFVMVDSQGKGSAPQDVTLTAGRHTVRVESPGYRAVERVIEVVPAVDQELLIEMMAIPSEFPYRVAGWTSLAAGAALIAAGVGAFLIFNGMTVGCEQAVQDRDGDCPKTRSATWIGSALMGVGAAGATLGGVWLYLDAPQSHPSQRTALNLGWQGRF